jgi:hypothetical protein
MSTDLGPLRQHLRPRTFEFSTTETGELMRYGTDMMDRYRQLEISIPRRVKGSRGAVNRIERANGPIRGCSRTERPCDTQTVAANPASGGIPATSSGAEAFRIAHPGTAAEDAATTFAAGPYGTINRCSIISFVVAVLYPLPHVAGHIVEAKRVWFERSNW